jgi:Arm DNA-binding domain
MPRIRLTKSAIDALPTTTIDIAYWDSGCPGFGVKVTPKGRKVFIVLYCTGGAGSKLRKYTIGSYGRATLHQARVAAQQVFAAKLEGRDPAAEKREAKRRVVADRVGICGRPLLLNICPGTAPAGKSLGSSVARQEGPGPARACTTSAKPREDHSALPIENQSFVRSGEGIFIPAYSFPEFDSDRYEIT